jgi:[ribosomal protein S5]-alanine N-acetyltransferase
LRGRAVGTPPGLHSLSNVTEIGDGSMPEAARYFLRTERIGFRPWTEADLGLAMGLWGDAEVTKLIGGPFSQEQVQSRLLLEIANMTAFGVQYWPIFLLSNDEHLGSCGLRPYRMDQGVYEVGVHIRSAYWGHGYAPEATREAIAYAFNKLGAAGLFAGHNPANDASRRLLGKLGFRYTHDEYYPPTGLQHPSYMLTADEFARNRGGTLT